MSKRKTPGGQAGWALICAVVCPSLPYGANRTDIKYAAYRAWRVGKDFPKGRIDETAQERSGWQTYHNLVDRALEVGLKLPEGHPGTRNTTRACETNGDYIDRMRSAAYRLRNSGAEHGAVEAEAIEFAIRQREGHSLRRPKGRSD